MDTQLFDYELPEASIAQQPAPRRDAARLLVVGPSGCTHSTVAAWPEQLRPGDVVVVNDTRVRRARLLGMRAGTGGRVEILLLHPLHGEGESHWIAVGRANRPLRPSDVVQVRGLTLTIQERLPDGLLRVSLQTDGDIEQAIEAAGQVPLPPYVKRSSAASDAERYQTVFASRLGSAAAPTAGLHLTHALLEEIRGKGAAVVPITLDIGLGTFRPVTAQNLDDHPMHEESYRVPEQTVEQIVEARRRGGRVVAVGTTVVRALESASDPACSGGVRSGRARTRLLIQPGHAFTVVDALLTNFHMPRSTLLALVCAFAGRERTLAAYRVALAAEYRFLSYGDAMWIPNRVQ